MHVQLENSELVYSDGLVVYHDLKLPSDALMTFLESMFKMLFRVDHNRNCHRCEDPCDSALTLHFGRPFNGSFRTCVPR